MVPHTILPSPLSISQQADPACQSPAHLSTVFIGPSQLSLSAFKAPMSNILQSGCHHEVNIPINMTTDMSPKF